MDVDDFLVPDVEIVLHIDVAGHQEIPGVHLTVEFGSPVVRAHRNIIVVVKRGATGKPQEAKGKNDYPSHGIALPLRGFVREYRMAPLRTLRKDDVPSQNVPVAVPENSASGRSTIRRRRAQNLSTYKKVA